MTSTYSFLDCVLSFVGVIPLNNATFWKFLLCRLRHDTHLLSNLLMVPSWGGKTHLYVEHGLQPIGTIMARISLLNIETNVSNSPWHQTA